MKILISQKSIKTYSGNPEKGCPYRQTVWQHE